MKTKKAFVYFGVLVLGPVIAVVIDHLIGVSFKDVGTVALLTHTATYMLLGGAVLTVDDWFG